MYQKKFYEHWKIHNKQLIAHRIWKKLITHRTGKKSKHSEVTSGSYPQDVCYSLQLSICTCNNCIAKIGHQKLGKI